MSIYIYKYKVCQAIYSLLYIHMIIVIYIHTFITQYKYDSNYIMKLRRHSGSLCRMCSSFVASPNPQDLFVFVGCWFPATEVPACFESRAPNRTFFWIVLLGQGLVCGQRIWPLGVTLYEAGADWKNIATYVQQVHWSGQEDQSDNKIQTFVISMCRATKCTATWYLLVVAL